MSHNLDTAFICMQHFIIIPLMVFESSHYERSKQLKLKTEDFIHIIR